MDKLAQAKQLSNRADNYMNQGNEDYAIACYDKIIALLKQALLQATSQESIKAVQNKVAKFIEKKAEASARKAEKQQAKIKITKFGFPANNVSRGQLNLQNFKEERSFPAQKKQQNQPRRASENNDNRKGINNRKPKIEVPSDIQDMIVHNIDVSFKDIVGLKQVKAILEQAVIRPRLRPDLYTGIRAPPRGLLLYGPPGNGKTFLCKALAKESQCTFFAISASSILNKLVGESQKTIKRVFAAAQQLAPSIIFIDEIDSMLTARSENQNQASRRLKTQFLVLMDGINSPKSGQVMVIGATNLPKQLDSAAKRRFSKMIYVGNPDAQSRRDMVLRNLSGINYDLSKSDMSKIIDRLQYYSASQIRNIVAQTTMIPLRELQSTRFKQIKHSQLRAVTYKDFKLVLDSRKPILSREQLQRYKEKI